MANVKPRSIPSRLLLLTAAFTCSRAYSQSANSKIEMPLAQQFVKAILAGDMTTIGKLGDANLKQKMTKELVTTANQQIKQGLGALKSKGNPRVGQAVQGHDVIFIPCTFERGKADAKVIFDASHKVVGCFMVAPGSP